MAILATLTGVPRPFQGRHRIVTTGRAILGAVNEDDLRKLKAVGSELSFGAGQMLIERGNPGTGLYVVREGRIVVEAPEGTRELGPGSVVGERALLSEDGTRTARVRALTYGVVIAVERSEVDRLCAEDPDFAERLARSTS
jgi:CRP-like cAMP-binding protein